MPILDQMVLEQNTEVGVYIWLLLTQRRKKISWSSDGPHKTMCIPSGHPLDPIKNDSPTWQGD